MERRIIYNASDSSSSGKRRRRRVLFRPGGRRRGRRIIDNGWDRRRRRGFGIFRPGRRRGGRRIIENVWDRGGSRRKRRGLLFLPIINVRGGMFSFPDLLQRGHGLCVFVATVSLFGGREDMLQPAARQARVRALLIPPPAPHRLPPGHYICEREPKDQL